MKFAPRGPRSRTNQNCVARRISIRLMLATLACTLLPEALRACPSCMTGDLKTANTYIGMTLLMSALPLFLVAGIVFWLRRNYS